MWQKIKRFFSDSETIFWARLHTLTGAVASGLTYVDPTLIEPLLTPIGFSAYMLANGVAMEYLRRRRAGDL